VEVGSGLVEELCECGFEILGGFEGGVVGVEFLEYLDLRYLVRSWLGSTLVQLQLNTSKMSIDASYQSWNLKSRLKLVSRDTVQLTIVAVA
jgi:hypothetical protein